MEPARIRLIVGYSFVALCLILLLWWIKVGVPWNENDSLGVATGLLLAIAICFYILRVWDFSKLQPYSERTMTAGQGLRNWVFPTTVFSIGFINFVASQYFSIGLTEVITTTFLMSSVFVLVFMILGAWIYRPR
jgi:hypothetical protein